MRKKDEGIIVWVNAYYEKLFRLFGSLLVFFLPIREKMKFNPKTFWNKTIVLVVEVIVGWFEKYTSFVKRWWIRATITFFFKSRRESGDYSASCSFASASSMVSLCVTSHHFQGKKNLDYQYKSVFNLTKVLAVVVSKKATFFFSSFAFLRETATTRTFFFRFKFPLFFSMHSMWRSKCD